MTLQESGMGQPDTRPTGAGDGRRPMVAGPTGAAGLGAYLRRLRRSHGYTLRKVQERATALGAPIDNSQLSRFEKGKALPSFEKLRALARVFHVPVQEFSDLLDLAPYERLKPATTDYAELLRRGSYWRVRGEYGRAFVTYQRALEVARAEGTEQPGSWERMARARGRMASALSALGKSHIAERELRETLRWRHLLLPATRQRALLQLSRLYAERGDHHLAGLVAQECLDLVRSSGDPVGQAGALSNLGSIRLDEGCPAQALGCFDRALDLLRSTGGQERMETTVLAHRGACLVELDRVDEAIRLLREVRARARAGGLRRVASLVLSRLGDAHRRQGDHAGARSALDASDALATAGRACLDDVLFRNAYQRWTLARAEGNRTRARVAFDRLRRLRSRVRGRFPEVERFDRQIAATTS